MRQCPFHHPPVSAQFLARLDAPPSYPRRYAPLSQCLAASREVVSLVCVQLLGALARASTMRLADRRDGVYGLLQYLGVVNVCARVDHRERDAPSVDHNMALRALLSFIRRIRAGLFAPRGRVRLPSPMMPCASRSHPPCPNGPGAHGAVPPTHPLRSIP